MVLRRAKATTRWCAALTAVAVLVPMMGVTAANAAGVAKVRSDLTFPRNETLYTSGTAYSPPTDFNPLNSGIYYTGTLGLLYEPLFLYNPATSTYIPWLATSGKWANATTYVIQVRNNVKWSDGSALTGADVAYSIGLAKTNPSVGYSNLAPYLKSVSANGNTVTVNFTNPAPVTLWQRYVWNNPVVPEAVWSKLSPTDQVTGANATIGSIVSSGPMTLVSTSSSQACYQVNPNWWGTAQLGLSFSFKYLCDIVNGSNNVELSGLLTDQIDWSNNFLPGINSLMTTGGDSFLKTYYPAAPYMMSANTAWLEMNTTKAPMNNVDFRKAVAAAINPKTIVSGDYFGIVRAANPTGLLPNLSSYIDPSVVKQYGFSYNVKEAKTLLKESGYKGQSLTLEVPDGWTDWMAAIGIIAKQLNAVGIKVSTIFPSNSERQAEQADGAYDMMIANDAQIDSNPWSYFDRVYQLPILKSQPAQINAERFSDPTAWKLVQQAATTPLTNTKALDGIYSKIEARFLQQLPEIPLWYNGAWFQGNDTMWKNYPSVTNSSDNYTPVMWGGYLGAMTTVLALAQLKSA